MYSRGSTAVGARAWAYNRAATATAGYNDHPWVIRTSPAATATTTATSQSGTGNRRLKEIPVATAIRTLTAACRIPSSAGPENVPVELTIQESMRKSLAVKQDVRTARPESVVPPEHQVLKSVETAHKQRPVWSDLRACRVSIRAANNCRIAGTAVAGGTVTMDTRTSGIKLSPSASRASDAARTEIPS